MVFKDRQDAGEKLAEKLLEYQDDSKTMVIGLPRGGVVVASQIAKKLNLPLDIVVSRKIGSPFSPELAIGAISETGKVFLDQDVLKTIGGVEKDFIDKQVELEKKEAERRLKLYRGDCPPLDLHGKQVILVDDGIATGATMRAAINSVKEKHAAKIIVAVPIAPKDVIEELKNEVDKVVCLDVPDFFEAIGGYYERFPQVEDEQVIQIMKEGD